MKLSGVWLPIITPFKDDKVDFEAYKRLIDFYADKGISGFIPLGTTGEVSTVDEFEYEQILEKTMEFVNGRLPVFVGLGGNNTKKIIKELKTVEKYKVNGILSVSPYYSRPDQKGIYEHFLSISEATDLDIVIYNIPYRTGRNIENSTMLRLAELKNIAGVKDSCGDIKQSMELILNKPEDFSVLTGEDVLFYSTLLLGGDGGILAASHLRTEDFVKVYNFVKENDYLSALQTWKPLHKFIPLLFEEPNPAPVKYYLSRIGLISSEEVRLPLTTISSALKEKLDKI